MPNPCPPFSVYASMVAVSPVGVSICVDNRYVAAPSKIAVITANADALKMSVLNPAIEDSSSTICLVRKIFNGTFLYDCIINVNTSL